ncbi:MAG: HNH endonuclease signature motif containing protein, partial [Terriglobales bacterium]
VGMSRRNWQRGRWRGRQLRDASKDPWHRDNWTEAQARTWGDSEGQSRRAQSHWGPKGTRFWARVRKTRHCWIWQGRVAPSGYGQYHNNGQHFAHRYAYSITNGPIPRGLVIMHECDVPLCCRPSHLRLGTQKENMARVKALGHATGGAREPRKGEEVNFAKICAAQARNVLAHWAEGRSQAEIARLTGIRRENVWCIVHRKSWRIFNQKSSPMNGKKTMQFRYDRSRRRLWVNCPQLDLDGLRCLLQQAHGEGLLPRQLDAVLFKMPSVTFVLRGSNLARWLAGESAPERRDVQAFW